jgi:hypothetical protein
METERTRNKAKRAWLPKKKRELLIRRYIEKQLDRAGILPSTREVLDIVGGGQPLILEILREYRCETN